MLIDETEWNIPTRDRDNMGELIAINDSILSLNKFEINTHKHLVDTTRKTMTMVVTPHKKGNPALEYTLSDNTVYIRKDVKQFSSTDFQIQYIEGFRDSIPLRAPLEVWRLENGSMTIDTLCYWIKK